MLSLHPCPLRQWQKAAPAHAMRAGAPGAAQIEPTAAQATFRHEAFTRCSGFWHFRLAEYAAEVAFRLVESRNTATTAARSCGRYHRSCSWQSGAWLLFCTPELARLRAAPWAAAWRRQTGWTGPAAGRRAAAAPARQLLSARPPGCGRACCACGTPATRHRWGFEDTAEHTCTTAGRTVALALARQPPFSRPPGCDCACCACGTHVTEQKHSFKCLPWTQIQLPDGDCDNRLVACRASTAQYPFLDSTR